MGSSVGFGAVEKELIIRRRRIGEEDLRLIRHVVLSSNISPQNNLELADIPL